MHCFLQRSLFIWHVLVVFHYYLSLSFDVGYSLFSVILFAFNKANYIQNIAKVCIKFSFIKKYSVCDACVHFTAYFARFRKYTENKRSSKCPLASLHCITCKTINHKPNICSFSRRHTSTNYYNFTAFWNLDGRIFKGQLFSLFFIYINKIWLKLISLSLSSLCAVVFTCKLEQNWRQLSNLPYNLCVKWCRYWVGVCVLFMNPKTASTLISKTVDAFSKRNSNFHLYRTHTSFIGVLWLFSTPHD